MTMFVVQERKVRHNIERVRDAANGRTIYAVLKSDGYGFGLEWIAQTLIRQGIRHFAISEFGDAVRLRQLSEDAEILLLNPLETARQLYDAADLNVTITISSMRQAEFVNYFALDHGLAVRAHIEVDTGMGRYGFLPSETAALRRIYTQLPGIKATGIYSHVYNARNTAHTNQQITAFAGLLQHLKNNDIDPGLAHMASSAVLFEYPTALFDAVRIGSAFTGRLVTEDKHGLECAGVVESAISEIRTLARGQNVGYGGVFKVRQETLAAVVPAGYLSGIGLDRRADVFGFKGFIIQTLGTFKRIVRRERYSVRIGGADAPVLGRVGANHLVADINGIDCCVGTTVLLDGNPMLCGNLLRVEYR